MNSNRVLIFIFFVMLQFISIASIALEKGGLIIRGGFTNVDIAADNGNIAAVGDSGTPTLTFTYLVTENLGVELLAGLPIHHSIYDKALGTGVKIGSTKHLPPALMFQYYFYPAPRFRTYIGVGLNHTVFFKETATGPLSGAGIELDASTGLVYQLGMDWKWKDNLSLNLDVRRWNIQTTAHVTGIKSSSLSTTLPDQLVFDVPLDPLTIGLSLTYEY